MSGTSKSAVTYKNAAALALLELTLLAVLGFLLLSCRRQTDLSEFGLPFDLYDHLDQLEVIKVPAAVTDLGWIRGVRELDASETAIEVISNLPLQLQRLDVSSAKRLSKLPGLPPSVRELDISFTSIEEPWKFSPHLQVLTLGGERVWTLEGLDNSLIDLSLERVPNLRSLAGLPPKLQSLSLSGSGSTLRDLDRLPPGLKSITFVNTQIRLVRGLPANLRSLTLVDNPEMEVELPPFLLSLKVEGSHRSIEGLERLEFLNHLEIPSIPSRFLPPFIRDLRIQRMGVWTEITPFLKRFEIEGSVAMTPPLLPRGLEELRWPGGDKLDLLPEGLKRLDIRSTGLTDLSALPPTIESLDISGSNIPVSKVPPQLRSLRFRFFPFNEIQSLPSSLKLLDLEGSRDLRVIHTLPSSLEILDISETSIIKLPALPPGLRELDISNTRVKELEGLPVGLRRLTVHAGQLASLAGLPETVTELLFVERQ